MASRLIANVTPSVTVHAAHNPSAPNILDSSRRQADSTTNVRTPDSMADTVPLEKAVNKPDANVLNPTNRQAGTEKYRHLAASEKNCSESPVG